MADERLNRGEFIQELVTTASEIRALSFRKAGKQLSSPVAMAEAMLKLGKTNLYSSLKTIDDERGVALTIDHYFARMGPAQVEQFLVGLSGGIFGCTILAIEATIMDRWYDDQYFSRFNNFIVGTPIASEPTTSYKFAASSHYSQPLDPVEETRRLREAVTKDPTYITILSGFKHLPYPVKIQLLSLNPDIRSSIMGTTASYREALTTLNQNSSLIPGLSRNDEPWLDKLLADL